jgi:hypothetical protein
MTVRAEPVESRETAGVKRAHDTNSTMTARLGRRRTVDHGQLG